MCPRILLIDDQLDGVESLVKILTRRGCEARFTDDPGKAIEIASDFQPHAVSIDIGMPAMDGYTLAQSLRRVPGAEHCKIIAVSGYPADEERLAKAQIDQHILKPVAGAVLAKLVHEAMAAVEAAGA